MYQAGWSKTSIDIKPQGYAMHGFGQWNHRAFGQESTLMARTIVLGDGNSLLIFCCMDLGYITRAMRAGIVERLAEELPAFNPEQLVLTCTHTHSGPGGCSQDAFYNVVTPGYVPAHVEAIVEAACQTITTAWAQRQDVELELHRGDFDADTEVAWNRSLAAYNRNPDVIQRPTTETHLALDRNMQLFSLKRNGQTLALLSLFGVHATCCGNTLKQYSVDNKGKAAGQAEKALQEQGANDPVAIFAQATAGDVSPFYQGPGARANRASIKGDAHYAYAEVSARQQTDKALALDAESGQTLSGSLDGVFTYLDFTDLRADPAYAHGETEAYTSEPCHGVAFFEGTPIDGPGMPGLLGTGARLIARRLKKTRLRQLDQMSATDRAYYERLYAAQGSKDILLEGGRKTILGYPIAQLPMPGFVDPLVKEIKRQARIGAMDNSDMVPTVLPLQVVRIGPLAIICCPGEFTTTAGRRVQDTVREQLAGSDIEQILMTTYCNDYMGYVTTCEEYQEQAYEGGHTIFGQWTLAAFQTCFARIAPQLTRPRADRDHDTTTEPAPAPADELAKRTNIQPPRK